jgi:hypothetical protein
LREIDSKQMECNSVAAAALSVQRLPGGNKFCDARLYFEGWKRNQGLVFGSEIFSLSSTAKSK